MRFCVVAVVAGNKSDCADRQVKREEGERLAREYNVAFLETSAKSGLNVEVAFMAVARFVFQINTRTPIECNLITYFRLCACRGIFYR